MAQAGLEPSAPADVAGGAEVVFHFKVADRLPYVCRLLRKAHRSGVAATVVADAVLLERLDRLLWTFDAQSFVPHLRLGHGERPAPHLVPTPVWLVESLDDGPDGHRVLVQLCDTLPQGLERFERIHEVVSLEPDEIEPARVRWRQHAAAGRQLVRHDAAGSPA